MHRLLTLPLFAAIASAAEPAKPAEPPKEKPFTPGGIYRQGDMQRPRPTVITPPTATTAPSDAIVLFDGNDLSKFIRKPRKDEKDQSDVPNWKIENGYAEIKPKGGDIDTKDKFGSCQIHLEWATPAEVVGKRKRHLSRRPGRSDLQQVSPARERQPQARRVAELRHHLRVRAA